MMLVACPHLHRYLSKLFPHRASFRSAHRLQVHAGDCVDGLVAYVHTYSQFAIWSMFPMIWSIFSYKLGMAWPDP